MPAIVAEVIEISDSMALEAVAQAWDGLFERIACPLPYASRAWCAAWAERHGRSGVRVVAVRRGNDFVGFLALQLVGIGRVRPIAVPLGTGVPGYLGCLLDPGDHESAREMARMLLSGAVGRAVLFNDLLGTDLGTLRLVAECAKLGAISSEAPRAVVRCVRFGASFEQYLQSRSGKSRHRIRHMLRNADDGERETETVWIPSGEISEAVLNRVRDVQRRSWMRRRGADCFEEPLMRALVKRLACARLASVWFLRRAETDLAFVVALETPQRLVYAWTAFDERFTAARLGNALTARVIRDTCERGIPLLDFSHGDAEYKRFWSNDADYVKRVAVGRGPLAAALAAGLRTLGRLRSPR